MDDDAVHNCPVDGSVMKTINPGKPGEVAPMFECDVCGNRFAGTSDGQGYELLQAAPSE